MSQCLSTKAGQVQILVLRDGVIAERGTFADLMHRNGVFAELYNTQFRDAQETRLDVA
jgi:ATP-binding cassette subfamily B protein